MGINGKWRIVGMPDYQDNYPDMVERAYILFNESGGQFAFARVTAPYVASQPEKPATSPGLVATR